jgi:hypothetical protein
MGGPRSFLPGSGPGSAPQGLWPNPPVSSDTLSVKGTELGGACQHLVARQRRWTQHRRGLAGRAVSGSLDPVSRGGADLRRVVGAAVGAAF